MTKDVEFMTEKEMNELISAAYKIAEERQSESCFSPAGVFMPWEELVTYPDSGVGCSPTKRKKILNSRKHHETLKKEILIANDELYENVLIDNLRIVADAERKASKEPDAKKSVRILVEAAMDFDRRCSISTNCYVSGIPFLKRKNVTTSPDGRWLVPGRCMSPQEYEEGRLTAKIYEQLLKLMPRENVNLDVMLKLEARQKYFDCHGVAYYRLTGFGRWFIDNPGFSIEDCSALCRQYERGEDMCYEKFFLNEAEKAAVKAREELARWQQAVLDREKYASLCDPDW